MQVRVQENVEDIGKCGCGRSPNGKCIGWHGLSEHEYMKKLLEIEAEKNKDYDGGTPVVPQETTEE